MKTGIVMATSSKDNVDSRRILGVDFGEKRVGVAVSDRNNKYSLPLKIIKRKNDISLINELKALLIEWGCGIIVIGLPDEYSSVHKKQIERIESFIDKLKLEVKDVNVVVWSESFTSKKAREVNPKSEHIDDVAASVILESYLESISIT